MPKKTLLKIKKMKIFYSPEMLDQPFPEKQSYLLLVEKPEELKDINEVEGTKLGNALDKTVDTSDNLPEGATNKYLLDLAVTELKLAAQAVSNAKIKVDAIYGAVVKAAAITETKIASNAISTPKIQAGAITAGEIATGAVTAIKIYAGAVTTEKIYAGAVTAAKITVSQLSAISANIGSITSGTITSTLIRTASSGQRVELDPTTKTIKFYDSGGAYSGYLSGVSGAIRSDKDIVSAQSLALGLGYALAWGGINVMSVFSANTAELRIYKHLRPSAGLTLGTSTNYWGAFYIAHNIYFDANNRAIVRGGSNMFVFEAANIISYRNILVNSLAADLNIGSDSRYWNEINYKYLTDRGCLGDFSEGVELLNGEIVSDIEALQSIKKRRKRTIYGTPMLDYKTMPKAVYRKATSKKGVDGAEMGALVSIMIGSIKELDNRLKKIEK